MWRKIAIGLTTAMLFACGAQKTAPASKVPAPESPQPFAALAIVEAGPLAGLHFEHFGVNPTIETAELPRSSFGLQSEDASLVMTERLVRAGRLPPPAAVRVEDFINAHPVALPVQQSADFVLDAEAFPSPNRPGYHVLRLTLQARAVTRAPRRVFAVIDTTQPDPLLDALRRRLAPADQLAVLAADGHVVQPMGAPRRAAVRGPRSTDATGLQTAYRLAAKTSSAQIVYLTDGLAHLDASQFEQLLGAAMRGARLGVELLVIAAPGRNFDDARAVRLAQAGAGRYAVVAKTNAPPLAPVLAQDAQAGIVFNPQRVVRYRLMGHERLGATRQARAHVPAGSTRTVLYELKLAAGAGALGTVQVDYLDPHRTRQRFTATISANSVRTTPSVAGRRALVAAALAEKLRGAYWVRGVSYTQIQAQLDALPPAERSARLTRLLADVMRLDRRPDAWPQHPIGGMSFDHVPVVQR